MQQRQVSVFVYVPSWWALKELQEFVVYVAKDASGGIGFVGPERCGVEWSEDDGEGIVNVRSLASTALEQRFQDAQEDPKTPPNPSKTSTDARETPALACTALRRTFTATTLASTALGRI